MDLLDLVFFCRLSWNYWNSPVFYIRLHSVIVVTLLLECTEFAQFTNVTDNNLLDLLDLLDLLRDLLRDLTKYIRFAELTDLM